MLAPLLVLLPLLLGGCLEQVSTTRIPSGAARNFFLYLSLGQKTDANAYWAPDYVPGDASQQLDNAIPRLAAYEFTAGKTTTTPDQDGDLVSFTGKRRPKTGGAWQENVELMSAHLIERGPGWRITSFQILCCRTAAAVSSPAP